MPSLPKPLRSQLEKAVLAARRAAEAGAHEALAALGVGEPKAPEHLLPADKALRNRLRARGRQAGDVLDDRTGRQATDHLAQVVGYEHWHRMLFARFLAENSLLLEPEHQVPVSLADVDELARDAKTDIWDLAGRFAQRMLPAVFRSDDPVLALALAPESRQALEKLVADLPREVFLADDSLGWTYQFWQKIRKEEVNASGVKIGADELSPVTQLFTEDYMVEFLLHNTLGAWWAGKVLGRDGSPQPSASATEAEVRGLVSLPPRDGLPGLDWSYLRFVKESGTGSLPAEAGGEGRVPPVDPSESALRPPSSALGWRPAAGTFEKWPTEVRAVTLLDPCMGSGHFLVFALPILARLRMEEENLTAAAAVAAVLRDNLHGLELDERCTQIAAFNLALAAWKLGGYQPLPPLHLACSGLSVGADKEEWLKLADRAADDPQGSTGVPPVISDPHGQDARAPFRPTADEKRQSLRYGMEQLHGLFRQAPILGSLIDPRRIEGEGLQLMRWDELSPLVEEALTREESDPDISELAVTAKGTAKAAEILAGRFTLVATNVPYLARGKQDEALKRYAANVFPDAKADLATCFVERCLKFCHGSPGVPPGNTPSTGGTPVLLSGTTALVTPQNWLFLGSYKHLRQRLLEEVTWESVVRLGTRAFETIGGEVVNVALLELTRQRPAEPHHLSGLDASAEKAPADKAAALAAAPVVRVSQKGQLGNPDASITFEDNFGCTYLNNFAGCYQGLTTADDGHWRRSYWEMPLCDKNWSWLQTPSQGSGLFGGRDGIVARALLETDDHTGVIRGREAWGKRGIAIDRVGSLCRAVYTGEYFHSLVPVVVPSRVEDYLPIAAFCLSDEFVASAKAANQSLSIDNGYLGKVPFDLAYWQKVAAEKYPNGLPKPYSSDPTQWLFNGHPKDSDQPLHVALARLLGYRWPRQTGSGFPDCPALGADGLEEFADEDGIVCLAPLRGERAAAERLRSLLSAALGSFDEHALIAQAGGESDTLEEWLRDEAFEQHAKLFHHRPFIWHVWDGRPDGFHVLVNYHRLCEHGSTGVPPVMPDPHGRDARAPLAHAGRKLLETLAFSYLGDWIRKQQDDVRRHEPGAEDRQIAAEAMQQELKSILAGEPPYDLFIRWKPLHQQPIGWEPDLNDGVRLNIRPFMLAKNVGRKGAGILRFKPNVNWDKADRGTEPARPKTDFPWFWTWDESTPDFPGTDEFDGNRWNSCHFTNHGKRAARERKENHV